MRPSVKFKHRSWNHICWSLNTTTGYNRMHVNAQVVSQGFVNHTKIKFPGYPKYKKQFLVIGQFPRIYKGGFDNKKSLKGKISQFNWWSRVLNDSIIENMAECKKRLKGDIISWDRKSFTTNGLQIELQKSDVFCDSKKKLFFFPGKRTRKSAEFLCGAHGGSVVTPESKQENEKVLQMYFENRQDCTQENTDVLGWIGTSYYNSNLLKTKFYKVMKEISYQNYFNG